MATAAAEVAPTTATAIAAEAATASPAIFARACFIDVQVTTTQIRTIKLLDGFLALLLGSHFNEAEAARAARLAILNHSGRLDRPGLREELLQIIARSLEREVADVKFHRHRCNCSSPLIGVLGEASNQSGFGVTVAAKACVRMLLLGAASKV